MAKRKLSKQQAWRVARIQDEKAQRAEQKEARIAEALQAGELGDETRGLIIAHFGSQVEVEDNERQRYRCFLRANLGSLVTGDHVVFRPGQVLNEVHTGVVETVLERESELSRPSPYNEIKPVAANIDFIVLVIAPEPHAHANLIDRYLVAAENCRIEPIILLNKIDLINEIKPVAANIDFIVLVIAPEPHAHANLIDRYLVAAENCRIEPIILLNKIDLINDNNVGHLQDLLERYTYLGYRILQVSAKDAESLGELKEFLNDRVSVFVGQSGVGKSSLIATLLPEEELKVGALSEHTRKGKHTTTTARLYHFPAGGDLIDSPGIREFGLWHMSEDEVLYGFRELRAVAGHCRFRDCNHNSEPGCALLEAVEEGVISEARFLSYKRIVETLSELG
jgi:ribosome biogenesis GTPase / thiamine phosphate phosphatase